MLDGPKFSGEHFSKLFDIVFVGIIDKEYPRCAPVGIPKLAADSEHRERKSKRTR